MKRAFAMSEPRSPGLPGLSESEEDYFLHVDMLVESANVPEYERLVMGAIQVLNEASGRKTQDKWKLRLALKADKPFVAGSDATMQYLAQSDPSYAGLRSGKSYQRYVHLWDIPRPELAGIMKLIPDEQQYTDVSVLLAREVQSLMLRVVRVPPADPTKGAKLSEVRRVCKGENLGEWFFKSIVAAPALEALKWKHYGLFQAITGRLNVTTEYWQEPPQADERAGMPTAEQEKRRGEKPSFLQRVLEHPGDALGGERGDKLFETVTRELRSLQMEEELVEPMTVYLPVETFNQ
jgi:hypothetical protein